MPEIFQRKDPSWDAIILLLFSNNVVEERQSEILEIINDTFVESFPQGFSCCTLPEVNNLIFILISLRNTVLHEDGFLESSI